MIKLSKILQLLSENRLLFQCPGCNKIHTVAIGAGKGERWQWNGDPEKPTFSPSIKVVYPANSKTAESKDQYSEQICHFSVENGEIRFLEDCTHSLAGQTVQIPDW